MLLDETLHRLPVGGERLDGRNLILGHQAAVALHISAEDSAELSFYALCRHGITPQSIQKKRREKDDYVRGVPERGLKIGSFLADGDVLQERGSRMWLDSGLSVPAFGEIQLHGSVKHKSLRGQVSILRYSYHSGDNSQSFF